MSAPAPSLSLRYPFLPYLLLLLPVALHTWVILAYAENIPWYDDVEMFVAFIQEYFKANTLSDKVYWLLKPSNEHRILLAKLVALLTYYVTGHMNFRLMIIIANLFMYGTLVILYRIFRSMQLPVWSFVPVPFFLLQPQFFLTSTWALTGLQHQGGTFLSFLVMYNLAKGGRNRFAGASFLQVLASLSMSNTLFGWLAGAVILWRQGHYRRLAAWAVLCAVAVFIYRYGYTYSQGTTSQKLFLTQPWLVIVSVFSFAGGSFDVLPFAPFLLRGIGPTIAGIILFALIAWFLSQMRWPFQKKILTLVPQLPNAIRDNFFIGIYILLLTNAAVVGMFRIRYGYNVILISNYMLYPALLLCVVYLNGLQTLNIQLRPRWRQIGLTLAVLLWAKSYFWHLPELANRSEFLRAWGYNQQHTGIGLGGERGGNLEAPIHNAMTGAVAGGYYKYPDNPVADYPVVLDTVATRITRNGDTYHLETPGPSGAVRQAFAVLQSDTETYLIPSNTPFYRPAFWLRRPVLGVQADVNNFFLRPGTYRVGWAIAANDKSIHFSRKTVTITAKY
ncbi:hypothetical protein [Fibrella aquatilis]|uniref:Uncharacterized protein n=1 Tax=Fibrella aquatilis TaxID=2817059 RepID=A0A939G9B3_9BACT|nr:hypothetical protein [Fibrella aquatilis]MBO0932700.1 hypothetical protein [Fibrella aquatilis]